MTKEEIVRLVLEYARVEEPIDLDIEVLEGTRPEGPVWRVPVRTDHNMPRRYRYYDKLADIAQRFYDEKQINVVLVPS